MVSSENHLFVGPVHIFSNFVHSACPGIHFHHFYHGQPEVALNDGRAQAWSPEAEFLDLVAPNPKPYTLEPLNPET